MTWISLVLIGIIVILVLLINRGKILRMLQGKPTDTILITKKGDGVFEVKVEGSKSATTHKVAAHPDYSNKLGWGEAEAEELVRRSFEFLLEREPKESILREFDLPAIQKYFPEYESQIRR